MSDSSPQLTDQNLTTNALRMNFLVMDPSGQYETGDVVTWSNKLVLRNRLIEEGGYAPSSCWLPLWAKSATRSTAANHVKVRCMTSP